RRNGRRGPAWCGSRDRRRCRRRWWPAPAPFRSRRSPGRRGPSAGTGCSSTSSTSRGLAHRSPVVLTRLVRATQRCDACRTRSSFAPPTRRGWVARTSRAMTRRGRISHGGHLLVSSHNLFGGLGKAAALHLCTHPRPYVIHRQMQKGPAQAGPSQSPVSAEAYSKVLAALNVVL